MLIATVYVGTLAVIFFDGEEINFDYDAHYLRANCNDIAALAGFFRDCSNYYNGVKKEVKDLYLN